MSRPSAEAPLCRKEDIPDPGARSFVFGDGIDRFEVFVVRKGDLVCAYENTCPHTGTPLDMFPDQFLTADRTEILCSTHGARFRIEDGFCVAGPCRGDHLRRLSIHIDDGGDIRIA